MDLTTFTHVAFAILGVGFLIFVHELGHFLAAKKVGIRVETFCIGFQPTIFGFKARFFAFTRGDTEYALGMIPFGGYVKMAGEELGDEKTGSNDEFSSKSISERALVLVAGAIMNLIFGFIFFVVAFAVGVRFETPRVGSVIPDGPAWKAGILPGDQIVSVNGAPKEDWEDLMTTIILAGLDDAELGIRRGQGEQAKDLTVTVTPTKDTRLGMPTIGIGSSVSPVVAKVSGNAEKSGLREGDRVLRFVLQPNEGSAITIPDHLPLEQQWMLATSWTQRNFGASITLEIERDGSPQSIEIPIAKVDGTVRAGAGAPMRRIATLRMGSRASSLFSVGDEVVSVNGTPVYSLDPPTLLALAPTNRLLRMELTGGRSVEIERDDFFASFSDIEFVGGSPEVLEVASGSAAAQLGLKAGDRVLRVGERAFVSSAMFHARGDGKPIELHWWDGQSMQSGSTPGVSGETDFGATFAVVLVPSPHTAATDAGIQEGDALLAINDSPVTRWGDFSGALAPQGFLWFKSVPESLKLKLRRVSDGSIQTVTLEPKPYRQGEAGFALNSDHFIKKATFGEACVLGSERAVSWMARIFLTLRALVTRQVDAKNLAGPIGILHISSRVVEYGLGKFLFLIGLISINLGIFNLLPFPILDGGHLVFLAIEKIKGSPVSERIQGYALTVAFVMLISLALFVTFHDLRRLFA